MAPIKKTHFALFICFSLLFVGVQSFQRKADLSEGNNESKEKMENEGNGEEVKEKEEKGEGEKKIASGEMEENQEKEKTKSEEQKEFIEIVMEDKETVKEHYSKIKARLEEEERKKAEENAKGRHRKGMAKGKVDELQGVANAVANLEMKCPGIFKRFWTKAVNFVKKDEATEKKEAEWAQNCRVLSLMKGAMVDWLEFVAKFDENASNGRKVENEEKEEESTGPNYPEKMTVRPNLQKVTPIQSQNGKQGPPQFEGNLVELKEILEIYEEIAKGKEPEDLRQLFWDNEAAYKLVKKLKQKLEEDEKHENEWAADEDEADLKGIWEEEKAILGGQMSEFKSEKDKKKYSEQVDEHKEKEFSAFGMIWNYGKSIKNYLMRQ